MGKIVTADFNSAVFLLGQGAPGMPAFPCCQGAPGVRAARPLGQGGRPAHRNNVARLKYPPTRPQPNPLGTGNAGCPHPASTENNTSYNQRVVFTTREDNLQLHNHQRTICIQRFYCISWYVRDEAGMGPW